MREREREGGWLGDDVDVDVDDVNDEDSTVHAMMKRLAKR